MDDLHRSGRHLGRNLLSCRAHDGRPLALVPQRAPVRIAPRRRMPLMTIKTWFLSAFAALLAFAAMPAAAQSNVYVMRHLNTPAGQADPDLLPEGQHAAEALAGWFHDERPVAIYVTDYKRTRQTVAPLAARLGLTPIVYDPADTPGLIARIRAEHGPVLVVGQRSHSHVQGPILIVGHSN